MIAKNTDPRRTLSGLRGFSLLQTSIILMVAALVMTSLIAGQGSGDANQKLLDSIDRLNKVEDGMARFMAQQGRLPCPADGQYDVNDVNFGWEAGYTSPSVGGCKGGVPSAPLGPDATGLVVAGAIPTKTLGLPDEYAFDAWGRRPTYTVDVRATNTASCTSLRTGGIQIKTRNPAGAIANTDGVMHAYTIHGPGGYGAWPAQGSNLAGRINTGIADSDKQNNAGVDASFAYSAANFTNSIYSKDRTATFDDIVYYVDALKNTCCIGPSCTSAPGSGSQGAAAGSTAGSKAVTVDMNGDGLADTIVCAPNASPNGLAGAGSAYIVFGSRNNYGSALPLDSLNGTNGVRIDGQHAGDHLCSSVTSGDVNGDDINDLLIGASGYNGGTGAVYVVLGGVGAWTGTGNCNVSGLAGGTGNATHDNCTRGWRIDGETAGDNFGAALASRDFNGDDFDDMLIGAPGANAGSGAGYLICGGAGPWLPAVASGALAGMPAATPTCGIKFITGSGIAEKLGFSVAMGNLRGDSYAGAILGAPDATAGGHAQAGHVYTLCGGPGAYPYGSASPLDVTTLPSVPCGTVFSGVGAGHHAGTALDVGDMNGDGITDLIIGAPNADPYSRADAGSTYVIYGKSAGFAPTFDLNSVNVGSTGFRIDGQAGDTSGSALYGRCDVNGDGIPDLIIGAPTASPLSRNIAGGAYVVFGTATALSTIDAASLDGSNGTAIYGATAGDNAGAAVTSGDSYNFGMCNIMVGAPGANSGAGAVYTVTGRHDWTATLDLGTLR